VNANQTDSTATWPHDIVQILSILLWLDIYIFCDHRLLFRQELRNKEAGIEGRSRTDKNDHKMKRDK
jgi:hypothetical protein